jgi:hypothetical protein
VPSVPRNPRKGNPSPEFLLVGIPVYLLDDPFSIIICRMSFAGKDDLYRHPPVVDNSFEPFEILEDEIGTFVGRKPAGKADRKGIGIQESSTRNHIDGIRSFPAPFAALELPNTIHQFPFENCMNDPQFFIGNLADHLPDERTVMVGHPVRARWGEIFVHQE